MPALITHAVLDHQLPGLCSAPHWYVGFSGGLDSTALLKLLLQWRSENSIAIPITAIHVDHGLQADSPAWGKHCEQVCESLQVNFCRFAANVELAGKGLESAAREARYQIFKDQLSSGDVLFLAHHLDDQIETFFLRLMRGAGLQGLSGMPGQRQLGAGEIARPLLGVKRQELEAFAQHWQLTSIEDPSNSDTSLDRNFLRATVLPLLETRWPGYRGTVSRASGHLNDAAQRLHSESLTPQHVVGTLGDPGVQLAPLLSVTYEETASALRHWLQEQGQQPPSRAALMEFVRQLHVTQARSNSSPRLKCSAYVLERFRGVLYLLPVEMLTLPLADVWLAAGEHVHILGVGQLSLEPTTGLGVQLSPGERLRVAWRLGGERCQPVERNRSSSLKKLLQEYAVPPWWRDRVPLLYLDSELVAVGSLWHCKQTRSAGSLVPPKQLYKVCWQPSLDASLD